MKKKLKTPTLVTTAILTLITVIFWVAFEVYRTITAKPAPTVPQEIISPLNPTLDGEILNKLSQRINLTETEVGNLRAEEPQTPTPIPTPEETEIPVATESGEVVASPSGTPVATGP